ncbi:histidine phosphatase family protein [Pseudomonas sp. LS44]|uniref:lipopolysaccharide core heptose(II)-phosphate phosphatase PmrG n=1 Tax=Pseudomonas sp. LS44 TaxID=1357074 RepID=UPI00215B1955|nr:histidine phosphatase family protein [Pseudomonas sp. LS44]UVE16329.1 histidine phosphatase family protein [Pseudomonas sp. LS44]
MPQGVIEDSRAPIRLKQYLPSARVLTRGLGVLLVLLLVAVWFATRTQVANLNTVQQLRYSGVYSHWAKGEVVVLVRHGERCDRSRNACLNDPTGITVQGSQVAADVGKGILRLGLGMTDVLSSPQVRTRQTAHFMFGKAIATQDWLEQCDRTFANAAFKHKRSAHNLILVTHSGCIAQLEKQLNVPGIERSSAYASALFVAEDSQGKVRILGKVDASEWRKFANGSGA